MIQTLDGYVAGVDGELDVIPVPDVGLFRYWLDDIRALAGSLYGRRMYEVMRYWDDDQPEWEPHAAEFAAAWRAMPKWVVSRIAAIGRTQRHARTRRPGGIRARTEDND